VFRATNTVLAGLGHNRLTLEAVAGEVGCTRQALVRRFGSKHALIRGFLEWTVANAYHDYSIVRAKNVTPYEALRMRFLMPVNERFVPTQEPSGVGNMIAFFIGARDDPELREILTGLDRMYQEEVTRMIRAAQESGEVIAGDPAALAFLLIAVTRGTVMQWTGNPSGTIVEAMARSFDLMMAPYLAANRAQPVKAHRC
jgi:AcrR family transcriptional regulator